MRVRVLLTVGLAVSAATLLLLRWPLGVHRALAPVAAPTPVASAGPAADAPAPPPPRVRSVAVHRGDTLVRALAREGVDRRTSEDIAAALRSSGADLKRLSPNDALEVTWDLDGAPIALRWEPSPWLGFAAIARERGWEVRRSETPADVRVEAVTGEVDRSLFEAIEAAGEAPRLVVAMVEIFSSDFDFTADTRSGDRFRLLVEKRYAGDEFVDYGRILVAQYVSDARFLTGIGYESRHGGRWAFYDPDGRSLKKSFLKSPLEFTRITSRFTYARPHPILGGVRPHLAIDYAAPIGTPVRAVADGRVSTAGWDGGFGLSVLLAHRSGYATMYNHLSRLAAGVRAGARVRQRQVIGYVGSTGLSTGPHLDYRVSFRGRWVNPLAEKFIPGEPIAASEHAEFVRHSRALVHRLETEAPF